MCDVELNKDDKKGSSSGGKSGNASGEVNNKKATGSSNIFLILYLSYFLDAPEVEALLCLSGDQGTERQVHHGVRPRELHRPHRSPQGVHEESGI